MNSSKSINSNNSSLSNNRSLLLGALLVGAFVGILVTVLITDNSSNNQTEGNGSDESKPLYWVAPMDDNYRRDKPGKSPMGMDLVPVYADDKATDNIVGGVTIDPDVVNNLGVRTETVERIQLNSQVSTVGYVQYDENKLIHIHPRVSGWVEKLYIKSSGESVTQGQPLYELYSPELVNAQEELVLALQRNNKTLVNAAEQRLRSLNINKAFIKQLKQTRQVKQRVVFYATQSGIVDNLSIREGFFVQPSNKIMSIGDLSSVWVLTEVFERQVPFVKEGDKVTMTLDFLPERRWQGQVDFIYPVLNEATRTLQLRLVFDNTDRVLKPNMFAQVTIQSKTEQPVLAIPKEAVIRTENQNRVVVVLNDNQFKSVEVSLGKSSNNSIEVLSGLLEGDRVVTSAQFLIDSESSKSSDFKRMESKQEMPSSVWVDAIIKEVSNDEQSVTAEHQPIEAWDWPTMTMDFSIDDSVSSKNIALDTPLSIEITRLSRNQDRRNQYVITGVSEATEQSSGVVRVKGDVLSVDREQQSIRIYRDAIDKWGRGAATVNFSVGPNVSLQGLEPGDRVHFTFKVTDDGFVITSFHNHKVPSKTDHSAMDHSNMDHSDMHDSEIDDSEKDDSDHAMHTTGKKG